MNPFSSPIQGDPKATDSISGNVELATDAETQTGTATDRAITPANLSARLEGAPTTLNGSFTGFTTTEAKTLNLTGALSNYPTITFIRLWVSNDPGADTNINSILTFYNSDSMTEDERILKPKFLNLTYTETNGGISATDTTDTVDDAGGLIDGDKVRFMGGTAEIVTLTATPTATGITFTAATQAHADNTGIVKVYECDTMHRLYDADSSSEIHAKLELLSAPNASMNVYMEVDILT
jgi:hypothetical protein